MLKKLKRKFESTHQKDTINGIDCFARKMDTLTPPVSDARMRAVMDCCERLALAAP
jgi:hypothetical protein